MIDLRDNPVAYIKVNLSRVLLNLFVNGDKELVKMVNDSWQKSIIELCNRYFPAGSVKITPHEGYDVEEIPLDELDDLDEELFHVTKLYTLSPLDNESIID